MFLKNILCNYFFFECLRSCLMLMNVLFLMFNMLTATWPTGGTQIPLL